MLPEFPSVPEKQLIYTMMGKVGRNTATEAINRAVSPSE